MVSSSTLAFPANTSPAFLLPAHREITSAEELQRRLTVTLTDEPGTEQTTETTVTRQADGYLLRILPPDSFRPGLYRVRVLLSSVHGENRTLQKFFRSLLGDGDSVLVVDQEVAWGLTAVNTDRDTYEQGETARVSMSLVDNKGHPLCDWEMTAEIRTPSGATQRLGTAEKTIASPGTCLARLVGTTEDYAFDLPLPESGTYDVTVTATGGDGETRTFATAITAAAGEDALKIERTTVTRTYPESTEQMAITVTALRTFVGTVTETLPAGFTATAAEPLAGIDGSTITWNRRFEAGVPQRLTYTYTTAGTSPLLTLLPPLTVRGTITDWKEAESSSVGSTESTSSSEGSEESSSSETSEETSSAAESASSSEESEEASSAAGSEESSSSEAMILLESDGWTVGAGSLEEQAEDKEAQEAQQTEESSSAAEATEENPEETGQEVPAEEGIENVPAAEATTDAETSFFSPVNHLLASLLKNTDSPAEFTFEEARRWQLLILAKDEERETMATGAPLMLEPKQAGAVSLNDGAAFTLLRTDMTGTDLLDSEGHLKDEKALATIAGTLVDRAAVERMVVQEIVKQQGDVIGQALAEDSAAVTTVKSVAGGGSNRRAQDTVTAYVDATLTENADARNTVSEIVSASLQPLLDGIVTEEMREQVLDALATTGAEGAEQTIQKLVAGQEAILQVAGETAVEAIQGREREVAEAIAKEDSGGREAPDSPLIRVALKDATGRTVSPKFHFEQGSVVLVVEPERTFIPGLYTVTVTVTHPLTGEEQTFTQDFAWGVLAMNTDQDRYGQGEQVHLGIGVLDDQGKIICDADVKLSVTAPSGTVTELSTPAEGGGLLSSLFGSAGTGVTVTGTCGTKDAALTSPDYASSFPVTESGTYTLHLTAKTANGTREMTQRLEVRGNAEPQEDGSTGAWPFIISRKAATRLYPVGASPMTVTVRFNEDFAGTITDTVPAGFAVSHAAMNGETGGTWKTENDEKKISWSGQWQAGETAVFRYDYDAPDVSPEFYLIGPLRGQSGTDEAALRLALLAQGTTFAEARSWQIANDDVTWAAPTGPGRFTYKKKLTVANTGLDEDLTDFPLLVKVTADTSMTTSTMKVGTGTGYDIAFSTATGAEIPYEREEFRIRAGSGSGIFWVKVPKIRSTANSSSGAQIYMLYGSGAAADQQSASAVWDANFKGVWHLSGATLHTTDSTSNRNHGTPSSPAPTATAGQIDGAASLDGTNHYITTGKPLSNYISRSTGTISAWVKPTGTSPTSTHYWDGQDIIIDSNDTTGGYVGITRSTIDGNDRIWMGNYLSNTEYKVGVTYTANQWTYVTWRHNGGMLYAFKDGNQISSIASGDTDDISLSLEFGKKYNSSGKNFAGQIDEVRISSVARSAEWIAYEYANMNDPASTVSFGSSQTKVWDGGGADNNWSTAGNWSDNVVPGATDVVMFDGTSSKDCTINSAAASTIALGVIIESGYTGTITQAAGKAFTVTNWTQAGGTFNGADGGMTLSPYGYWSLSGGTFNAGSQTITAGGDWTYSGGTFNAQTSKVYFYKAGSTQTITGNLTFNNVEFHRQNLAEYVSITNSITVSGLFTTSTNYGSNTIIMQNGTVNIQGDAVIKNYGIGSTSSTTNFVFNGTGPQLLNNSGTNPYLSVPITINKPSGTLTMSGTLNTDKDFTYVAGTIAHDASSTLYFYGGGTTTTETITVPSTVRWNNVTISKHSYWTMVLAGTMDVGGTLSFLANSGSPKINGGMFIAEGNVVSTTTPTGTAQLTFVGAASQSWSGAFNAGAVLINKTGNGVTVTGDVALSGTNQDLTLSGGTLNLNGYNLTVNRRLTIGSGTTLMMKGQGIETIATGSKTIYPSASLTLTGDGDGNPDTIAPPRFWPLSFGNLTIASTDSNDTYTLSGSTTLNKVAGRSSGSLLITSGTLNATASNYNMTVGGNWTNKGTFTAQNGTVTLNGANQTMSGSTTFYNLTKSVASADTLTFGAGTTQTISHALTLQGASSVQRLSLRSSETGTQWAFNSPVTTTVAYVDVQDSNNQGAMISILDGTSRGRGNNTNWTIPSIFWTGRGADNNCSTGANWDTLVKPSSTDDVFVGSGSKAFTWDASCTNVNSLMLANGYTGTGTFVGAFSTVGNLTVASGGLMTAQGTASYVRGSINVGGDLTIGRGGTIIVRSSCTTWASCNVMNSVATGSGQSITAANITIGTGGVIRADGQGFAARGGPGQTQFCAAHGGAGNLSCGATYGNIASPTSLGSGGATAGGGAMTLSAAGTIAVFGTVSANGVGGYGAGGSIFIPRGILTGAGTIRASVEGTSGTYGGGGGRISLNGVSSNTFTGTLDVTGNSGASGRRGYAGTIYLDASHRESLTLGGAGNMASLKLGYDGVNDYTFGSVTINAGSSLQLDGHPSANSPNGRSAILNMTTLNVEGSLNADALGFAATFGPAPGSSTTIGGSHGGMGAGTTLTTYGSITNPSELGSGGSQGLGNSGGGSVHVVVSGTMTVNGTVSADVVTDVNGGGPSGGSVNITAGSLTGDGTIRANGATTNTAATGGGGRVACKLTSGTSFDSVTFQALGKNSINASYRAAAGTIYLEDASDGTNGGELIIDNNGTVAPAGTDTRISSSVTDTTVGSVTLTENKAGKLAIDSNQTLTITGQNTALTLGAGTTVTNNGTMRISGTSVSKAATAIWTNGVNSQTIFTGQDNNAGVTIPSMTYGNFKIENDGTTFTLAEAMTASGNVILGNGTLDVGSDYGMTVVGSWTDTGSAIFVPRDGTVNFIGGGQINSNDAFTNVTVNGAAAVSTTTLAGHWKFDEGATTTTADASGNGHTGTLTQGPTWTTTMPTLGGINSYALRFDGTNDYVTFTNGSTLNPGPMTYTAWVKPNYAIENGLFAFSSGTNSNPYLSFNHDGTPLYLAGSSNYRYWSAAAVTLLNDGGWHHLTFSIPGTAQADVTSTILSIDGMLQTSGSTVASGSPSTFSAFRLGMNNTNTYDGLVDEVRVYNGTLTSRQLKALASGNEPGYTLSHNTSVSGNLTLTAGTLHSSGSTLTLGGNWINNGATFTGSGTVTLTGVNQTIGGSADTTFFNLVKSVSAEDTLTFTAGRTITVQSGATLQGADDDAHLLLRSSATGVQWMIDSPPAYRHIRYVDVKDSWNTHVSPVSCEIGCVNSLNNLYWIFPVVGLVYAENGTTPLPGVTVALSINGEDILDVDTTDASGVYKVNLGEVVLSSGDVLTLFLSGGDEAAKAATVTVTDGVSISGLTLIENRLILRHESAGPVTTATLALADDADDADITALYSLSGDDLTVAAGRSLEIHDGDTFVPAGAVTLSGGGDLDVSGTLRAPSTVSADDLTVDGRFSASGAVSVSDVTVAGVLATETSFVSDAHIVVLSGSLATEGPLTAHDVRVTSGSTLRVAGLTARDFNMQGTFTSGGDMAVRHLTATGTLALGSHPVRVTGNWRTDGGIVTGTSVIAMAGTGSQTIESPVSVLPSVVLSGTGGIWTMSGALTTGTNLTVGTGRTLIVHGAALTVPGTLANYGMMELTGNETTAGFTNDALHGTVAFTGDGGYSGFAGITAFHHLTLSGAGIWTLPSALTVNGDLTIARGTLVQNAKSITVGGSWTDTGGTFTRGGAVTFTGSGTIAEDEPFDDLTIQSALEDVTVVDPLSVSGSLTLASGRLSIGEEDPSIRVEEDWVNTFGSFSAGSGTVLFTGDEQAVQGSTLFWNLEKRVSSGATWTFDAGDTQSVRGTWTARGAAGQFLRLRSSEAETPWKINPTAYDLAYIDVSYSDNISGGTILAADNAVNGGNNDDWAFPILVTVKNPDNTLLGAGRTVSLSVNGHEPVTSDTEDASSVATFNDGDPDHTVVVESGSLLAFWLSGGEEQGALVTRTNGVSLSFILYTDTLTVANQVGSNLTNGDLLTASMTGAVADINALYTMSGTEITGADGMGFRIENGSTFQLTDELTAHDFDINGTLHMDSRQVTVTGSWDATGGTFDGTNTVRFTSQEAETITVNTSAFNNVVFVVSQDPTAQVGNWRTTDNFSVNGTQYVQNGATNPHIIPVISNVTVTPYFDTLAVINWQTDVESTSRVVYGTASGSLTLTSTASSGTVLGRAHAVTLSGLTPATTYYARPVSGDYWNNTATGAVVSFRTLEKLSTAEELAAAEDAAYGEGQDNAGGGGKPYDDCTDLRGDPFTLTELTAQGDGSTSVTVTWTTNHAAVSAVQWGLIATTENQSYSFTEFVTGHSMEIHHLVKGSDYLLKAASVDQCGNVVTSDPITVSVEGEVTEETQHAAATSSSADGASPAILQEALDTLREMAQNLNIAEFKKTLVAQNEEMRQIAELLPGPFLSGEPKVTVTDSSATVTWTTDEPSNSMVAFSPAAEYRAGEEYAAQTGDPDIQTVSHQVTLTGLTPGATYHYSVRSDTPIGTKSASKDFTFETQKKRLNIDNYSFKVLSPSAALFLWETNVETTSRVTFIPYRGSTLQPEEASSVSVQGYTTRHEVTADALEPGTVYSVEIAGKNLAGTEISQTIPTFSTSEEKLAPVIAHVKADVAISPGKDSSIQMIITWDTNKRSTSRVRYQQGVAADPEEALTNMTPVENSFSTLHTVILTGLSPGSVYSFQAESVDYDGHTSVSKTFTVLTPRQQESIVQVITKEFESTFGWLNIGKGR